MTRSRSISVTMADGSKVTVQALLTNPDASITEADEAAIRACIEAISERRMDPQRAQRRASMRRRDQPIEVHTDLRPTGCNCTDPEDDGEGICLDCGQALRKSKPMGGGRG
jgi:hypothetical protein